MTASEGHYDVLLHGKMIRLLDEMKRALVLPCVGDQFLPYIPCVHWD